MPKRRCPARIGQDSDACFLGREREARRIGEALAEKESLMISGPAEMGKTALMKHVLRGLPKDVAARCLYLSNFKNLQDFLRKLITTVFQAGNPALRRQLHAEKASSANFEAWLKAKPSPQLKGTLYRSVERCDYRLILDHAPPLTYAIARVIKELFWMRDTPVYLLVRNTARNRVDQFSHFFYWGRRQRIALGPLPKLVASDLLEQCIGWFGLAHFDLDEFREEVIELSGCVPGAIVKMCAMAADEQYQYGSRIKTKLVHIDYLMSGSSVVHPAAKREH